MMLGKSRREMDNFCFVRIAGKAVLGTPNEDILYIYLNLEEHVSAILPGVNGDIKLSVISLHHAA